MPAKITQLDRYECKGMSRELLELQVRVEVLAERFGLVSHTWQEDGLGEARGLLCRLPSGHVVMLQELQLMVLAGAARGPFVFVDTDDLATAGIAALRTAVLAAFGLDESAIGWQLDADAERRVIEDLRRARQGHWSLWRQDDNGNAFRIAAGLDERWARRQARQYESLGHKQCYWVQDDRPA